MRTLAAEKIRVRIFNRDYDIDPGGLTPLEASQLAAYVDQKMHEISTHLHIVDTQKVAVLAALNIAFELSQEKGAAEKALSEDNTKKIEDILASLEKALK
ncbi:MAG TPA: cell division protein ZapA [Elusimicrobiota bacterium]|nr:cell division protein ZapA [Elusimicrobiota bacterium]